MPEEQDSNQAATEKNVQAPEQIVVFATCAANNGRILATKLVEEKLAACVNIIPSVTSVYRFNGAVVTDDEEFLLIKTNRLNFDKLAARIKELHSYEIPEIICIPSIAGYKPYLDWIDSSLR